MAYPDTTGLTKTHLDQSSDDPSQARAELEALYDKVVEMLNNTGTGNEYVLKLTNTGDIPSGVLAPNSTAWDGANKTVSTSDPSGGSDGDIWFKREA